MPTEKRNRFRQVDDRVQHRNVDMRPFVRLHRKEGEEIHKSLECDDGIGTVVDCRNMLGRYTYMNQNRVSNALSIVVICLGDTLPLKRSERSSHPPASLRNPTAK